MQFVLWELNSILVLVYIFVYDFVKIDLVIFNGATFMSQVFENCMTKSHEDALKIAEKLGVKLTVEEKDLEGKPLLKVSKISNAHIIIHV